MRKFLISLLLILSLGVVFCAFSGCNTQDDTDIGTEGLIYYPLDNDSYAVGGGEAKYLSEIVIPSKHLGKPVTKIADEAFVDFEFSSISIPNTITTIGTFAFSNCDKVKEMILPINIVDIGKSAFAGCDKLDNMNIPVGVNKIAEYMFWNCANLKNVTIKGLVSEVGDYAFSDCVNLSNIVLPESIEVIGSYAFNNCLELENFDLPSQVNNIKDCAFYGCSKLSSITIPSSLTFLGNYAFYNCVNLAEINYNAVECSDLKSDSAAFWCAGKSSSGITLTIDKNVKKIPAYLFYSGDRNGAPTINSITFAENSVCTSIGTRSFSLIKGFKQINIPKSVLSIDSYAFTFCPNLNNVKTGDGVKYIGVQAFSGCDELTEITIGKNVDSISYQAFSGCDNLVRAIFENTVGWTVAPVLSSGRPVDSGNLSNPTKAATYLITTYETYRWERSGN